MHVVLCCQLNLNRNTEICRHRGFNKFLSQWPILEVDFIGASSFRRRDWLNYYKFLDLVWSFVWSSEYSRSASIVWGHQALIFLSCNTSTLRSRSVEPEISESFGPRDAATLAPPDVRVPGIRHNIQWSVICMYISQWRQTQRASRPSSMRLNENFISICCRASSAYGVGVECIINHFGRLIIRTENTVITSGTALEIKVAFRCTPAVGLWLTLCNVLQYDEPSNLFRYHYSPICVYVHFFFVFLKIAVVYLSDGRMVAKYASNLLRELLHSSNLSDLQFPSPGACRLPDYQ